MCGCGRRYVKTTYNRRYATVQCKDRVAQRTFREKAKAAVEYEVMGRQS
jgi:hypothetical protein